MECLLFHSNPLDRNSSQAAQIHKSGWSKYAPKLFYDYIIVSILPKLQEKRNLTQNDSYEGTRLLSREHLLTSFYQIMYNRTIRNEGDCSPAIISRTTPSRKKSHILSFMRVRIENIRIQMDVVDENNEGDSLSQMSTCTRSSLVSTSKVADNIVDNEISANNTTPQQPGEEMTDVVDCSKRSMNIVKQKVVKKKSSKKKRSKSRRTSSVIDISPKDTSNVTFNPMFRDLSLLGKLKKNIFFRHYMSKDNVGYILKDYDVLDMIILYGLKLYHSRYGWEKYTIKNLVRAVFLKSLGACEFRLTMFFENEDKMYNIIRDRLRKLVGYVKTNEIEDITWSIDPLIGDIDQCELSVRDDTWCVFLSRLKHGITKSAYKRLLEAFEYITCWTCQKITKIAYLNEEEINLEKSIDLDTYFKRYDHLNEVAGDQKSNDSEKNSDRINESSITRTKLSMTQEELPNIISSTQNDEMVRNGISMDSYTFKSNKKLPSMITGIKKEEEDPCLNLNDKEFHEERDECNEFNMNMTQPPLTQDEATTNITMITHDDGIGKSGMNACTNEKNRNTKLYESHQSDMKRDDIDNSNINTTQSPLTQDPFGLKRMTIKKEDINSQVGSNVNDADENSAELNDSKIEMTEEPLTQE